MSTIKTIVFHSDDDYDDETLQISDETLTEDEEKDDEDEVNFDSKPTDERCRQKAMNTLMMMMNEASKRLQHNSTVSKEDPLLEFHQRVEPVAPRPVVPEDIFAYLVKCSGSGSHSTNILQNIVEFKRNLRATCILPSNPIIKENAAPEQEMELYRHAKVLYSGHVYKIKKKVNPNSTQFKSHLNKQKEMVGGGLNLVHQTIHDLKNICKITALEKSRLDWKNFKELKQLGDELDNRRKRGYLSSQAFLTSVQRAQYMDLLEARRKRRVQGNNFSQ